MLRRFSIAPMMDCTDRHDRMLLRLLSPNILLYSEMVVAQAIIHGDRTKLLGHDAAEHPLALQIGGSDPAMLAEAARIGEQFGYGEINLNVGCPSDRVKAGRFGACLMAEPQLVADCVAAMQAAVRIPVTVKTRIGIDRSDSEELFRAFIDTVAASGCRSFTVHARKAWLDGLSPKENRTVPPLRYDVVHRLKRDRPELEVILNGGLTSLEAAQAEWQKGLDGVMLGRAPYANPWLLNGVDRLFFGASEDRFASRADLIEAYKPYVERTLRAGTPLPRLTRHMLGLFDGIPGARHWRRVITTLAPRPGAGTAVLDAALVAALDVQGRLAA